MKNYVQKWSHNKCYTKRFNSKVNTYLTNSKVKIIQTHKTLISPRNQPDKELQPWFSSLHHPKIQSGPFLTREWLFYWTAPGFIGFLLEHPHMQFPTILLGCPLREEATMLITFKGPSQGNSQKSGCWLMTAAVSQDFLLPILAPASPPHTTVGQVSARVQGFGEWPFPPGELERLIFTPFTSPSIGRKSHGFAHTQDSNPDPLTCCVTMANGPYGCGLLKPLVPPPGKRRRWECSCLQGCHDTAVYFLMWHFDLSLIINY